MTAKRTFVPYNQLSFFHCMSYLPVTHDK